MREKQNKKPDDPVFYVQNLEKYGLWESKPGMTLEEAVIRMNSHLTCFLAACERDGIIINAGIVETPEIVFAGKKNQLGILSRVSSIIEATIAAATLWSTLKRITDVAMVKPREWQSLRKGKSRKIQSKDWSLMVANSILHRQVRPEVLHTQKDENVADAIVMGQLLMEPIFNQKIIFH